MDIKEILNKGRDYPMNFFYGDIGKIKKKYELLEGLFLLGEKEEERELFWGVNTIENLKDGLIKVREENKGFIFRYAGRLSDVIKNTKIIANWGYHIKSTYVGYFLEIESIDFNIDDMSYIEELKEKDEKEFLKLERNVFDLFYVSEDELKEWVQNKDHMVLIYKIGEEIKGFVMIKIYGDEKELCFLRALGVAKGERGKGIGEKLLRNGLKRVKEKGVKKSMLWVDIDNKGARGLYEKIGYKQDEKEAETVFSTVEKL